MKEKNYIPRQAAEVTLKRVKDYEDLNAPTEKEGEEILKKKTVELWDKFAVQGLFNPHTERIDSFTDLDGKGSLWLLRRAGILDPNNAAITTRVIEKKTDRSLITTKGTEDRSSETSRKRKTINYVAAGDTLPGMIHLDTGEREGVVSDEDASAFFDHHGPDSGLDSSATKKVYEALTSLGLLKRDPSLDRMVAFITQIDNGTFPYMETYFPVFHQTVLGLERFIQPQSLYQFFKDRHRPTDRLSNKDLERYGLTKGSEKQKKYEDAAKREFAEAQKNGFVIPTKDGGKALVSINKSFPGGYLGAGFYKCKLYIIWNPSQNNFFISNNTENLPLHLEQGKNIRGKMWIKSRGEEEPLRVTLQSVIDQVAQEGFVPTGALAEYLAGEKEGA
ncbi:MAG: hypothetical protein KGI60_03855 [Patescibacteria group bacterium]|nr:hypothetical protein [Patescibacteria group bacterium]